MFKWMTNYFLSHEEDVEDTPDEKSIPMRELMEELDRTFTHFSSYKSHTCCRGHTSYWASHKILDMRFGYFYTYAVQPGNPTTCMTEKWGECKINVLY
jgi:hypothetical protein